MCSVQDESELLQPDKREKSSISRKCMKCDEPANVIIRINDAMCRECFTSYTTHKFRSAFGKSKLVRDQERVLVAYSGGHCSSAMVHLIQQGLSKRAKKKLRFIPSLVYIEEGVVTGQSSEDRCRITESIIELMKATQLSFSVYTLEQAFEEPDSDAAVSGPHLNPLIKSDDPKPTELASHLQLSTSSGNKLSELLKSAKTLTAKQNLVDILRLRILASVARQQGVDKVLLGSCATRLSVRLLSNISQGQGAHLPYEISFADRRFKDVILIRPMREFTSKEVTVYNTLNDVKTIFIPNLSTKVDGYSSIEQLTEMFVTSLQAEYPNTVSTIFRTGEKFDLSEPDLSSEQICSLCQCPLDTDVPSSSALNATKFSQSLCAKMAARRKGESNEVSLAADSNSASVTNKSARSDVDACLCYGCQIITQDLSTPDRLPLAVSADALHRSNRRRTEEEISQNVIGNKTEG